MIVRNAGTEECRSSKYLPSKSDKLAVGLRPCIFWKEVVSRKIIHHPQVRVKAFEIHERWKMNTRQHDFRCDCNTLVKLKHSSRSPVFTGAMR